MSNDDKIVRSITPVPDEDILSSIIRLKSNPDFIKFKEIMLTGRAGVLSYLSTAPAFTERQCHYVQGRVHELADLDRMINGAEQSMEAIQKGKAEGGL